MSRVSTQQVSSRILEFGRERPLKVLYYTSIALGLIIRMVVSLQAWGMKHPDEIYQSLEMAHYLVYDTGYVPPEFQSTNTLIPSYAAARSWLFPLFFAAFMYVGEFLGLNYLSQTLPLIKFYMAIHATLLIPAVYKLTHQITSDEVAATIAAFMVAFWFKIIEMTVRTFTNTFFLPLIFYGIYRVLQLQDRDEPAKWSELLEIGFLLGLSTYIRIDTGIIVFAFFVVYFKKDSLVQYLKIGLVSFGYWVWGAWIDYNLYDQVKFFSVIINWFTFNVIEGYSALFGVRSPLFYVGSLLLADLLLVWLLIMIAWPIVDSYRQPEHSIFDSAIGKSFAKLGLVNIITWVIYSNFWPSISFSGGFSISIAYTHKETRFVIGALVLFLIQTGILCRMMIAEIPTLADDVEKSQPDMFHIDSKQYRKYRNDVAIGLLVLFLLTSGLATAIRDPTDHFEGINRSLTYIGQHAQPTDIYIGEVWFVTGYYTYSHVSANTSFHFHPLHDEDSHTTHIRILSNAILDQADDTYMVLPWYADTYFTDIWDFLEVNNWVQVYEYHDTYVFTQIEE